MSRRSSARATARSSSYRSRRLVTVRSDTDTWRPTRWAWISGTDRCSAYRRRPTRAMTSSPNSCRGNANAPSASGRYGFLWAVQVVLRHRRIVRVRRVTPARVCKVRRLA